MELNGILVIDKPAGMTSHDVVAKVRRIAKTKRVGHTGTLDPDVRGVLPVCLGPATRLSEYMLKQSKGYIGSVRFGCSTDTQDASGTVIEKWDPDGIWKQRLNLQVVSESLKSFLGTTMQTPPQFSAVKIDGKRAFEHARKGEKVSIPPRKVHFYELELLEWHPELDYPEAKFRAVCSKGTYIRTFCEDLGKRLGVPALMSELVRIQSGPYRLEMAHSLQEIERFSEEGRLQELLLPGSSALPFMPKLLMTESEQNDVWNGRSLLVHPERIESPAGGWEFTSSDFSDPENGESDSLVQVLDLSRMLRAIYRIESSVKAQVKLHLRPVKVFKE